MEFARLDTAIDPRAFSVSWCWPSVSQNDLLFSVDAGSSDPTWPPELSLETLLRLELADKPSIVDLGDAHIATELFYEPIKNFEGAWITVEATYYLRQLVAQRKFAEPLVAALGGEPLALAKHVEADLEQWKAHKINPYFVFDGDAVVGEKEMSVRTAKQAVAKCEAAWKLYTDNQATSAVAAFGNSSAVQPKSLYPFLMRILIDRDVKFCVAPFSAGAQIAQFEQINFDYCDGIMGSDELLLHDIDNCVIKNIDFESGLVSGVVKSELCKKLHVSADTFQDALLMTGTSFLPTFPPLLTNSMTTVKDALNLLRTTDRSVLAACTTFGDVLKDQEPDWLDKYQKAKMSIKHSIVFDKSGAIIIKNYETLTGDHHEYTGLRLPDEFYAYAQYGAVRPTVMDWFTWLEIYVQPPLDGGEAPEYRKLLTEQLVPSKQQAISLHISRLHRSFKYKPITMKFWFDRPAVVFDNKGIQDTPDRVAGKWCVPESIFKTADGVDDANPSNLRFALTSLQNKEFAAKTLSKAPIPLGMKTFDEVMTNTLWRFLHLRGYIDNDHQLTTRGQALATTLRKLDPSHNLEEAALLAFELIHYDNLNTRNRHDEWIGSPLRGDDHDKACNLLISRVSCLVKLRHNQIGYTGPLSKNLLAYHSIIAAVSDADRTLVEAVLSSLLLFGQAERDRDDFKKLGVSLPFYSDIDTALGIAVKTYLDDHCTPNSTAEVKDQEKQHYVQTLLPHAVDFPGDLDKAFGFFDALHAGVQVLGSEISKADKTAWDDAHKWLSVRR